MTNFSVGQDTFEAGDLIVVKWQDWRFNNWVGNACFTMLAEYVEGEYAVLRVEGPIEYYMHDTGEVDEDDEPIYEPTDEIHEVCLSFEYTDNINPGYIRTYTTWVTYEDLIGPPTKDKRWISRRLVKMMEES